MTDPIKSLELLVESRGKATPGEWAVDGWNTSAMILQVQCYATNEHPNGYKFLQFCDFNKPGSDDPSADTHFTSCAANFAATEAPRLLAIIRRQREALELMVKETEHLDFRFLQRVKYEKVCNLDDALNVARAALNDKGE